MEKIYLLTQDHCPKCEQIKMFLKMGLQGKYDEQITLVHRQKEAVFFKELVEKHQIMQTPCFVYKNQILRSPSVSNTKEFLDACLNDRT